jgi:predicted dehydrogenase
MEAGKHVIIEKPVATALADANRLLETRDRTRRIAAVNFMMRYTPISEVLAF